MTNNLKMSENEINDITKDIDIENIRNLTFQKIDNIKSNQKFKIKLSGSFIISIFITISLAASALASYKMGYFNKLWPDNTYIEEEQFEDFSYQQISDGVKMTVSDILQGSNNAMVILAFERLDGKEFPWLTDFGKEDIKVDGSDEIIGPRCGRPLDNPKSLTYRFEIDSGEEPLAGRTLSVDIEKIINNSDNEKELNLNIANQYNNYPINISVKDIAKFDSNAEKYIKNGLPDNCSFSWEQSFYNYIYKELKKQNNLKLPLDSQYPEYTFMGTLFIGGKLNFAVRGPKINKDEHKEGKINNVYISKLTDSRNGKTYESDAWGIKEIDGTNEVIYLSEFGNAKEIKESDFRYLKPTVNYNTENIISNGNWSFSYTFDESKNLDITREINIKHTVESGIYELTKINISVLGINLYGKWIDGKGAGVPVHTFEGKAIEDPEAYNKVYNPEVKLITKNGTEITLKKAGGVAIGTDRLEGFKFEYSIPDNYDNYGKKFVSRELMRSISHIVIDGQKFPSSFFEKK